jgi:hypothetical protein
MIITPAGRVKFALDVVFGMVGLALAARTRG